MIVLGLRTFCGWRVGAHTVGVGDEIVGRPVPAEPEALIEQLRPSHRLLA